MSRYTKAESEYNASLAGQSKECMVSPQHVQMHTILDMLLMLLFWSLS